MYPARFAAVVPVAGACDPDWADHYGTLPIWAFHGARDRVVRPTDSVETIDAIRKQRGETDAVRLTLYPDAEHGIAETVYQEADLYRWMLRHRICGMRYTAKGHKVTVFANPPHPNPLPGGARGMIIGFAQKKIIFQPFEV